MWNVDVPSRDELISLASLRQPGIVSIYLPTTPISPDAQADRIALKNLASDAVSRLEAVPEVSAAAVAEIEDELADLVDDDSFWENQAQGLAIVVTAEHLSIFRLPTPVVAQVHVSDRAFLKPLLSITSHPMVCYVLALAEGGVRLIEVPADLPPSTVRIPELPKSAADAAGKSSIGDRSHSGRLVGSEGKRTHIRHYARKVDAALRPTLAGDDVPLILAAVEPVRSIFRALNSYPHLVDTVIETNPDRATDQELAAAGREVLETVYADMLTELGTTFEARRAQGRGVTDVADAARAATAGAVDTLLIDRDHTLMGFVDEQGAVTFDDANPAAYGVIDEISRRVLLTGGRVLSVEAHHVPTGQPVAAILRFAI